MNKRPDMKTTKAQIVEWGRRNIDECGYGVDASEMDTHCWRCGYERSTERCHVIPYSLGGPDQPSNYRLLCNDCHREAPNVNDSEEMDKWIRRTNVGSYNLYWELRSIVSDTVKEVSYHWGDGLNDSTRRWIAKQIIEKTKDRMLPFDWLEKVLAR